MKWFRCYNADRYDARIQGLKPPVFKFWFNLMCLSSERADRGTIPTNEEIAIALRVRKNLVDRFMSVLESCGLVTPMAPVESKSLASERRAFRVDHPSNILGSPSRELADWSTRQPISDDGAKRIALYRARTSGYPRESDVTLQDRTRNVTNPSSIQKQKVEEKEIPSLPSPHLQVASKAPVGVRADDSLPTRVEPKPEVRLEPPPRPVEPNRLPFPEDGGKVEPGKHDMPLAVAKELYDDLWDTYENPGLCRAFLRNRRAMPVEAWRWTFREVGRYCDENDQPPRSLKLFLKFAKDWEPGMKGGYDIDVKPADPPRPKYTPEQLKGFAECAENIRQLREASKLRMANLDPWKMAELGRGVATGEILMPLAKSMREFEPKRNPNY